MKKLYILSIFLLTTFFINAQNTPFITTWEVDYSTWLDITIPTEGGGYNYTIDFGDGTVESNVTGDISHTYTEVGTYMVSISGDFPRIKMTNSYSNNQSKIKSIEQWGGIQWQSMESAFAGCENLVINATDMPDLSQVTDMSYMLSECSSFNSDINNWDVSNVLNMSNLFYEVLLFNKPINNWEVSNVVDMSNMFYGGSNFNQPIDNWDVSNVTDMSGMFYDAYSFNQSINSWDVSNVTNMNKMFMSANMFNQPLNNWDVSGVTDMGEMFSGLSAFNQPINSWNVSNVTNMSGMFSGYFNQPIDDWDVSNVTNMSNMFSYTYYFNQPLNNWDVSSVTNMQGMFNSASSFNQPLNNWDVSNVTNMSNMFSIIYDEYSSRTFNQPIGNWDVSNVIDMSGMFSGNESFNQPINDWDISSVINMESMFEDANSFNQPLNDWDVSSVTNMRNMFSSANNFNQPLNNWDVSGVTDMSEMFSNMLTFNQDLSEWMFNQNVYLDEFLAYSLVFDISNFDNLLNHFIELNIENKSMFSYGLVYCDDNAYDTLVNNMDWTIGSAELLHNCGAYPSEAFVTRWEVDDNESITIPTVGNEYNYTIDFGDNTIENNVTGTITHVYEEEGIYRIIITGNFPRIRFQYENRLKNIEQWGDIEWQGMEKAFLECENLVVSAIDTPNLSQVTNMSEMFSGCESFNSNINNWGVSNVTNMSGVFYLATNFNQPLNDWDVSSVTNMSEMFHQASRFNQPIDSWDVSNVINMSQVFSANSFNQPINNWDVSNVANMREMLANATSFNHSINDWDVSSVTNMSGMFSYAEAFNQPLSDWDVSSVTDMNAMFIDAEVFNHSLNDWDVSNVTDMSFMFSRTTNFNQPLNNWDVSSVTNMSGMFKRASLFNQSINNWDVSNVANMYEIFSETKLFNQPLNNWDISNFTDMNRMFFQAESFNQNLSEWNFNTNTSFESFVQKSNLNVFNYDALLARFVELGLEDKYFSANNLQYCNELIRNQLIEDLGWNITGDSLAEDCTSYNLISGTVAYDENNDGCDENDTSFNGLIVNVSNTDYDFGKLVNQDGSYSFYLEEGTYEVTITNLQDNYTASPETTEIIFADSGDQEQVDFCITANQTIEDLNITLLPIEEARPGFEADYQLVVQNMGTQTVTNAEVNLTFDETKQSFVTANQTPTTETENNLTFNIDEIQPFQTQVIDVMMQTFEPPTVNGDDVLNFTALVSPDGSDYTPEDNTFVFEQTVVNSFDPNDKQVLQGAEIYEEQTDEYLDYLIRFQNTGTASAINVRVADTLDAQLDWNTLQMVNTSHDNYRVEITDGNVIEFIFDDIHLPAEIQDEPASHGFIAFKIKPKSEVTLGDIILGKSYIYFDFNEAIITNEVSTEVVEPVLAPETDFTANETEITVNQSVSFTDISTNNPETWEWTFEGGTPASSTESSPTVTYTTEGVYTVTLKTSNTAGEDAETKTAYITVTTLGVKSYLAEHIHLYPNPSNGVIYIQSPNDIQLQSVELYNLQGRKLLSKDKNIETLHIENLSAGLYLLKITTNKGVLNQQVVKK